MTLFVAPIVEGVSEVTCLPGLLTRVWNDLLGQAEVEPLVVLKPNECKPSSLLQNHHPELGRKLRQAYLKLRSQFQNTETDRGFILILLDADSNCPKTLADTLGDRIRDVRLDLEVVCVFACQELENWFKAAAVSLSGVHGLPENLTPPTNPEAGQGSKWIGDLMKGTRHPRRYKKSVDAPILMRRISIKECYDNSRSFRQLCTVMNRRCRSREDPPDCKPDEPANQESP